MTTALHISLVVVWEFLHKGNLLISQRPMCIEHIAVI